MRLYRQATGPEDLYGYPSALFVCDFARRRPVRLAGFPETLYPQATNVRFNRGYVAFALTVTDAECTKYDPMDGCTSESVRSYGVHRGRLRASAWGNSSALAMTSGGWLAWLEPPTQAGGSSTLLVLDSRGRRVLDSGAIDPASLIATGATVAWTNAGVSHSAQLH